MKCTILAILMILIIFAMIISRKVTTNEYDNMKIATLYIAKQFDNNQRIIEDTSLMKTLPFFDSMIPYDEALDYEGKFWLVGFNVKAADVRSGDLVLFISNNKIACCKNKDESVVFIKDLPVDEILKSTNWMLFLVRK